MQYPIKISRSASGWEEVFSRCGLDVAVRHNHISGTLVRLWDIGLRPFSPFMIQMANTLSRDERARIKQRWVDETYDLFEGFLKIQSDLESTEPAAFFLFVLSKR